MTTFIDNKKHTFTSVLSAAHVGHDITSYRKSTAKNVIRIMYPLWL